jgi:hypothetical protein
MHFNITSFLTDTCLFMFHRIVVNGSRYGQLNYGTIWTGNMGCLGTATDIRSCPRFAQSIGHNTACNHNNSVGIICSSKLLENSFIDF